MVEQLSWCGSCGYVGPEATVCPECGGYLFALLTQTLPSAVISVPVWSRGAMRGGANPGIDLAGCGDPLRFVQKAAASELDRVVDRVRRAVGVSRPELRPQCLTSLTLDQTRKEITLVVLPGLDREMRGHHLYRAASPESGQPFFL
ncbi:MAG: hypothetical protein ACRDLL_00160 [Solirubrobacterales bacterium]